MADTSEDPVGTAPDRQLPRRRSTQVDRSGLDGVIAREQLEAWLRVHDDNVAGENLPDLDADQLQLLRTIAAAAPTAEDDARIRHRAIAVLGRSGDRDGLNLIVQLARFDQDPAVRASALGSLADTGLLLAAPILRDAQGSRDPSERVAAEKAIVRLASIAGSEAVIEAARAGSRSIKLGRAMAEVIESAQNPQGGKSTTQSGPGRTSADSRTSEPGNQPQ